MVWVLGKGAKGQGTRRRVSEEKQQQKRDRNGIVERAKGKGKREGKEDESSSIKTYEKHAMVRPVW